MVAIAFPLEQQLTRVETPFIPPGSKATLSAILAMSGLPFIMDAATLRAIPRLPLSSTKGDIDVVVVEVPDANRDRAS